MPPKKKKRKTDKKKKQRKSEMAAKIPELNYSCEICGSEGFSDEEMRAHMVVSHLEGAASCPFCDLGDISPREMLLHVNTAHLDYLTPERELLAFIDDDPPSESDSNDVAGASVWSYNHNMNLNNNIFNNNNNNNIVSDVLDRGGKMADEKSLRVDGDLGAVGGGCLLGPVPSVGAGGSGSPLRSQLSLNLHGSHKTVHARGGEKSNLHQCPLCAFRHESPMRIEEHVNRQHFDLTSPSFPSGSSPPDTPNYNCPLCVRTFQNSPDLELHVNIEHKDILSPAKSVQDTPTDGWTESCPVCCTSGFRDSQALAAHIEEHFNQKAAVTPMTPDVSSDRLLAREIEKREKEVRRLREQKEFEMLRAQYGMDNQGNFREQSLTNMQRAVYAGEMSVADYYERQIELRAAEKNGIDDGSSCTKGLVQKVRAASTLSNNVVRTYLCTTVDHYASTYGDKGWGCGYRNMQMMLSSLLHHTGYNELLFRPPLGVGLYGSGPVGGASGLGGSGPRVEVPSRSAMPSISRLQQHIEWAWRQGFDVQGCEQLGGRLFNTRKWIGATEAVTLLSSIRIRCQLVDFHRPTGGDGSHPELFAWIHQYFQKPEDFIPPLYLQHQGHSRTIVGVEQMRDGQLHLLVFDPSHTPHQMSQFRNTATASSAMRLIRKSLAAMKARQYQVVAVTGMIETEQEYQQSKVLRSVRVPQDR